MTNIGERDMDGLQLPFNITETVCSISESPQKQFFGSSLQANEAFGDNFSFVSNTSKKDDDDPGNYKCIQTENVHLFLSDMLITSVEQMQWNELKKDLDFSRPVDPHVLFEFLANTNVNCVASTSASSTVSCDIDNSTHKREGNSIFYTSIPNSSQSLAVEMPNCSMELESKAESEVLQTFNSNDANLDVIEMSKEMVVNSLLQNYFKRERRRSFGGIASNTTTVCGSSDNLAVNERQTMEEEDCLNSIVVYATAPQNLISIPNELRQGNDCYTCVDGKRLLFRNRSIGTWTPLKKKFIYDLPLANSKDFVTILSCQGYRCAGCSVKFNNFYAKRSRFCYYYSKVFCQCCHRGEKSIIPAFILHNWNFKELPVCDTAFRFLRDNEDQPVFDITKVNPSLYKKVKNLRKVRDLRVQVSHMWQYVQLCSQTETYETANGYGFLKTMFTSIVRRLLSLEKVNFYSMLDLVNVANRNFLEMLEPLVQCGAEHILTCEECQQRGFLCQICVSPDNILFPFQLETAYRCDGCGALSHATCRSQLLKKLRAQHVNNDTESIEVECAKCERIQKKRIRQLQKSASCTSERCDSE